MFLGSMNTFYFPVSFSLLRHDLDMYLRQALNLKPSCFSQRLELVTSGWLSSLMRSLWCKGCYHALLFMFQSGELFPIPHSQRLEVKSEDPAAVAEREREGKSSSCRLGSAQDNPLL